jgi:hypothetical protein
MAIGLVKTRGVRDGSDERFGVESGRAWEP